MFKEKLKVIGLVVFLMLFGLLGMESVKLMFYNMLLVKNGGDIIVFVKY